MCERNCSPMPTVAKGWPIRATGVSERWAGVVMTSLSCGTVSCEGFHHQRVADRFQPAVTEFLVWFEMRAFGPFVPGVYEQQAFFADEEVAQVVQLFLDVDLECFRRGMDEAVAPLWLTRRVVPAWKHGGIALIARQRTADILEDGDLVVIAGSHEIVPQDAGRLLCPRRAAV